MGPTSVPCGQEGARGGAAAGVANHGRTEFETDAAVWLGLAGQTLFETGLADVGVMPLLC